MLPGYLLLYLLESKEEDRNRDILGRWVHGMRDELQATGSLALYVHPMHINNSNFAIRDRILLFAKHFQECAFVHLNFNVEIE